MAYFNEKSGFIEFEVDDLERLPRDWAKDIVNKIIWGDEVPPFYKRN